MPIVDLQRKITTIERIYMYNIYIIIYINAVNERYK